MRQAIVTKFHGATNSRGSRISATAAAGRVYVSYDHALDSSANHCQAARALATKLSWEGNWRGGGMPDATGYVFVDATTEGEENYNGFNIPCQSR